MTDTTKPPKDPNSNVISIFDREKVDDDDFDYELNDADLQGFVRVLSFIQNLSAIGECEIKVDYETVSIIIHTTDCNTEEDEDIKRFHVFSYKAVIDMYLPLIHANLPKVEKQEYLDLMTATMELALETVTMDLPDDEESED